MVAAFATFAVLTASGCSGFFVPENSSSSSGGNSTGNGDYVYVANQTTGTLAGFSVGSSAVTPVSGSPYSLGFTPNAVAINPANTIVFVSGTSGGLGFIDAFSIGSNGNLSLLNQNNVGLADPISLDISPDGQWLIGLDANALSVDEYQINASTGQLTLANGQTYVISNAAVVPRGLKISPNGNFVFAAIGTAGDLVFPFNTTTGVISNGTVWAAPANSSENALAISPNGNYLYVARSGTNGGLAIYTISSAGVLTAVTGSPFTAGSQPFSVVVSTSGSNAYVANQLDSTISGYSLSSSGTATALTGSPYTNASQPSALAVDNSGKYLLAISNAGSPDLTLYSFDSTTPGKLNQITTTSTGTDPTGPVAIAATH